MKRDFVGTCYIIHEEKILLIFHKKLQKWLPPGGHLDPNELPHEGAIREALEETGLEVELLSFDNDISYSNSNARTIPRPFLTALEEIPAHKDVPVHQHIDFIYLSKPIGGTTSLNSEETDAIRWFTEEEMKAIPDCDIFSDTKKVMENIFKIICPIYQST